MISITPGSAHRAVALLAEGVDRNAMLALMPLICAVALLAEGVDRNQRSGQHYASRRQSPSSRRAWIEISKRMRSERSASGRPPRGGRG